MDSIGLDEDDDVYLDRNDFSEASREIYQNEVKKETYFMTKKIY